MSKAARPAPVDRPVPPPGGPVDTVLRAGAAFVDFFYPRLCLVCHARREATSASPLCSTCHGLLAPAPEWRCARCGAAGFGTPPTLGNPCRLCPPSGAPCLGTWGVSDYNARAARAIHLLKYRGHTELAEPLAAIMAPRLAPAIEALGGRIDMVVPVPLHPLRRLRRGFNQSAELVRGLAHYWQLPMASRALRRTRWTRQQVHCASRDARSANVKGAFAVRGDIDVDRRGVLLIDDVITSGATVRECARALRGGGAREVWAAAFIHARLGRPDSEEMALLEI